MKATENIRREIFSLEKKFWTAMREQDLEAALELTDFPCIVAGAHGVMSVDREEFEKMFKSNREAIKEFDFDEDKVEVRQVGPDTAVIAYQVDTTFGEESKSMHAVDTSTWVRRNDKWTCAMHTETELAQN